jgi:hypothetical protein
MISSLLAGKLTAIIPNLLKDTKGKWSSKRTVSGVLAFAAVSQIDQTGITIEVIILALISVIPLCFSVFEKKE